MFDSTRRCPGTVERSRSATELSSAATAAASPADRGGMIRQEDIAVEEVTHWERGEGWAGLAVQQLREDAGPRLVHVNLSHLLLKAAAEYISEPRGPFGLQVGPDGEASPLGWRRGRLSVFDRGGATSTLGAISMVALPFGWTLPEHMAHWRAAALVLHRYLGLKGRMHKNPIATLDAWDMAPERTGDDVFELLDGAASGQPRCRVGRTRREGCVGPGECWSAATRGGRCRDHQPDGFGWTGNRPPAPVCASSPS